MTKPYMNLRSAASAMALATRDADSGTQDSVITSERMTTLTGLLEAMDKKIGETQEVAERALNSSEGLEKKVKEEADEKLTELSEARSAIDKFSKEHQDILQRFADFDLGERKAESQRSTGQQFVDDEHVAAYLKRGSSAKGTVALGYEGRDVLSVNVAPLEPTQPVRDPIAPPDQLLLVRDLFSQATTNQSSIQIVREDSFTDNTAAVAEGQTKPVSDIQYVPDSIPVITVANMILLSKQAMDDVPRIVSIIDGRLRYGHSLEVGRQLLLGDGAGGNMLGVANQAVDYVQPTGIELDRAETKLDRLRLMALRAALSGYPMDAFAINLIDWANIELAQDGQGRYIIGQVQGTAIPTLWGSPVAASQEMAVGTAIAGAFRLGGTVYDRQSYTVDLSTEHADLFGRNMVALRAESRLALEITRPDAFVKGSLSKADLAAAPAT